jgi:hypothetical protein
MLCIFFPLHTLICIRRALLFRAAIVFLAPVHSRAFAFRLPFASLLSISVFRRFQAKSHAIVNTRASGFRNACWQLMGTQKNLEMRQ